MAGLAMAGPGVYQLYLGRSISFSKVKEVRGPELHVILSVLDTLNTCWYIYRRAEAAPLFGTETDPDGHTRELAGDGLSRCIVDRHRPDDYRHLPNLVLLWLWTGLSLSQITVRYVNRHPRQAVAVTFTHMQAQWGGNCVRAVVDQGFVYYLGTEGTDEDFQELHFDSHVRAWCLPRTGTPVPRHVAQWLVDEAYRLGMDRLVLDGAM